MRTLFIIFVFYTSYYSISFSNENKSTETLSAKYLSKKISLEYEGKDLDIFIHYPQAKYPFAKKVLSIIKKDFPKINKYFKYIPQSDVHLVVASDATTANGSATVFPRNLIYLHDFPPLDGDSLFISKDWVRILVVHEYIHIVAMEMTGGFFDFMRTFLGSFAKWSAIAPRWWHEGIAMWGETNFTEEGRLRHPWIRSLFLEFIKKRNSCKNVVCLENPPEYPFAQMSYWFGGIFFEYVEKERPGSISCITSDYSRNLPFMFDNSFSDCTDRDLDEMFADFLKEKRREARAAQPFCGFKDAEFCKKIKKKYRMINWFKGVIENDRLQAFVIQPNIEGRPYHPEKGEKLVIFDKKRKKFKSIFLDRVIEKIYVTDSKSSRFFISYLEHLKGEFTRKFSYFNVEDLKVKKLKIEKKEKLQSCQYYLGNDGETHYCLRYKNSRWAVYKGGKKEAKKVRDFKALESISPVALKKNSKLAVEMGKTPTKRGRVVTVDLKSEKVLKENKRKIKNSEDYWGLGYMGPKYLMLDYFVNGSIESFGLFTSMNDPLNRHLLSLSTYYSSGVPGDQTPYSGGASYFYTKGKYSYGLGYNKLISQGDLGVDEVNIFETKFATIRRTAYVSFLENTNYSSYLTGSQSNEDDTLFNFRRKMTRLKFGQEVNHSTNSLSSVYRDFMFDLILSWNENESFDAYKGVETKTSFNFRLTENLGLSLDAGYGKLYKTDKALSSSAYRDGVIYGGGASSFFSPLYRYPSYLIPFSNVFGNEMIQGKLEFAYNFSNPYISTTFIPFYFKRAFLLLGAEYIESDILLQSETNGSGTTVVTVRSNPYIASYYTGLRTNFDLLYVLPISLDWIYSVSDDEFYDSNFSFVLNTNVFF